MLFLSFWDISNHDLFTVLLELNSIWVDEIRSTQICILFVLKNNLIFGKAFRYIDLVNQDVKW